MNLQMSFLVEALVAVQHVTLITFPWLLADFWLFSLPRPLVLTQTLSAIEHALTLRISCFGGVAVCLACIAFIKVSTSVAKLTLVVSVGSEVDRLQSVTYVVSLKIGFDWTGDALSDLTRWLSTANAFRGSPTVARRCDSVVPGNDTAGERLVE